MKWVRFAGVMAMTAALLAGALLVGGSGSKAATAATAEVQSEQAEMNGTWMALRINGTAIEGDTYHESKKGMIQVLYFEQEVKTAREAGSGMATGRRQYQPLLIRKRIDKASPLLMKALTENSVVDATFGFYRPNPTGDGTEERFYEIGIRRGRVASVKIVQGADGMPMEEVTFTFQTINWTYTNGGITHEDTWDSQR